MKSLNNRQLAANPREIFNFHGGVHPEQNKKQSCDKGILPAPVPPELVIPLSQHIGAEARPVVEVGDKVLKGQLIAEAHGFVSAAKHAPTSGTIHAIEKRPVQHPSGMDGNCIVLRSDFEDKWCELSPCENFHELDRKSILEKITQAGVAGLGGAGFPSAVKLNTEANKVDTLIINSVECEPYITADDVLIREHANEILTGAEILDYLFAFDTILIGIEDNKPEAIAAYEDAISEHKLDKCELLVVPTKYPSGGEKQIIQLLTGKEVPAGGLPADLGILCHNTGSLYAIYEAVRFGIPLIYRVTTVTGNALSAPQNYWSLLGTPFKFLLEQCGIHWDKLEQLVMGGPMMGFSVHTPEVPLVKTTNCILAAADGELRNPSLEQACIRCGSCAEVCPAGLLPQQLYWYTKAKELEKAEHYHLSDCIECGACSYVCPSNIPLVQYFRFGKGEARKKARELKKSEISRERFEARKARLEREEAEKEARRKAKAEARKAKQKQSTETKEDDALETAFQLAKTNAAKASKQLKEAEKALEYARKDEEQSDKLETLETSVASLKEKAEQAQESFKKALNNKKAATKQENSTADNPLAREIETVREQSADASAELKAAKKALLSAKSGSADISQDEEKVALLKARSDELKAHLRELLQQQKNASPEE